MKNKCYIAVLLCLALLFAACAPKEKPTPEVARPAKEGRALFEDAEQKFRQSRYSEAQALYSKYAENYPDTDLTPAAVLKLGIIRSEREEFEKARRLYQKVISEYPDTSYAQKARVKILASYVNQGKFRTAADWRSRMDTERLGPGMRLRADLLAGDAYMALEQYERAYQFFTAAYRAAQRDQRKEFADRLLAAIANLEPAYIESELDSLEGKPPSGFLMFQQGLNLMSEHRIGDALSVLKKFRRRFAEHPLAEEAKKQIVALTSEAFFEGHTLGCVLPLSGKYRVFGHKALRGIELALAAASRQINPEPPFKILVRDSESDPETARKAVEELADKKVAAIVGPIEAAPEAASAAQKIGVPIITLTQKAGIAERGDYVFRNFLTPNMQVSAIVDYTTGRLGIRRFAVLYPDEAYGRIFLHRFWDRLIENNARLVGAESYNPAHTDFSEPIKKLVGLYYELPEDLKPKTMTLDELKSLSETLEVYGGLLFSSGPFPDQIKKKSEPFDFGLAEKEESEEEPEPIVDFDALLIPDAPDGAGLIIPQLRYYDINDIYLLGTNLWHSQKLIDTASHQINKAIVPEGFYADSSRKPVREFVTSFKNVYGYKPGFIEAVSFDSAMIICRQISRKSISTRPALRQSFVEMPPFEGVTGQTRFLDTGEAEKSIYLLEATGRGFSEITN
ncbi:MAG: penicillin-binding protein activator [Desulfobacterales bacterium]|nr:penicillin-binding protein activator [Desulfobacterales bacterium]